MESLNIVFTGKEAIELRREPVAELEPDKILVETTCTLISTGTECICYQRNFTAGSHWDQWIKYPFYPGYSLVGRVIRIGSNVAGYKIGDRIAAHATHCQFVAVNTSRVWPIPDAVSDEEASWATLSYIVQHGFRKAQLQLGETVVVIGVGMLGQLLVQYARVAGASEVIAIDTASKRLEMAAAHGATRTLVMGVEEALPAVMEITGGKLADVVFDMTGHAAVFANALKLVRRYGKLVLIGDTGTPSQQHLSHDVIKKDLQIIGAHSTNIPPEFTDQTPWTQANMVQLFYRLLSRGQMRVSDLITHRFLPSQAAEVYRLLITKRSEVMGVVFDFRGAK